MKVCFAGERTGMTLNQRSMLEELLCDLGATELYHCDNPGADEQAHRIARKLGIKITLWPFIAGKRAGCKGDDEQPSDVKHKQLMRAVDASDAVLFAPSSRTARSGSTAWSIARKAQHFCKRYAMIETFGSVLVWQGSVCLGMMTKEK